MPETTETSEVEEEAPVGDELADVSVSDFFRRLYQITYSKVLGLIIILVFAVLMLIGAFLPQAPVGGFSSDEAHQAFLMQMRPRFGGWTQLIDFLGLFDLFSSAIFLTVVVALAISIAGCTTHRLPQLWGNFRHPRTHVSTRFFDAARYRGAVETGLPDDQALEVAANKLQQKGYRVVHTDGGLYADKFAWGGFGTVAAHLSFLIILAAFVVSAFAGYKELLIVPVGGEPVAVGNNSGLTVAATSFDATASPDGRPLDYVSHVIVNAGGQVVAEQDVRVNTPLSAGGLSFHQTTYGLSANVVVKGPDGKVEYEQAVPMDQSNDDGSLRIGVFRLPARGLTVQVLTAAGSNNSQLPPGKAGFLVFKDDQDAPLGMQAASQGETATVGDLTLTFVRESQYTGITARSDPGAILMWIGSILLVVGMTVTFACRHRRVWLRAENGQLKLAGVEKDDSGMRQIFVELLASAATWFDKKGRTDAPVR